MATKKSSSKSAPARKTASRTTKKAPSRAAVKTKPPVTKAEEKQTIAPASGTATKTSSGRKFRIKRSYVILAVTVLVLAGLLWLTRSLFVAAVVNGQPISRLSVVREAEKQSGKQVLTTLVRNTLIEQEARKQNVSVTDKEIDDEIKKLESNLQKQGQKLDQVLEMQGMSRDDLRKLIRLDKMVGKMVGKDIKITDQQVEEYIKSNQESLPQGQNENELKASVKEQLRQQQLNEKVRVWLENLQKNANINPIVDYYTNTQSTVQPQ
jgi:foldase protein PrsA